MGDNLVLRETQGSVTVLTLNRPERRNALSRALVAALGDTLSEISVDQSVRAIVLTGAGESFCAGMDLKEAAIGQNDESENQAIADLQGFADLIMQIHAMTVPTVAALNGDAYAGGAGIMGACDLVVAADVAKIGYPEVKRGLLPAVIMNDLLRQVGERRVRELLLTGDPISTDQAERWGLVNRVVPLAECRQKAIDVARSLAAGGPLALATTKQRIDGSKHREVNLRGAAALSASVLGSDEAVEGIRAFLEKRPPSWALESERAS